jgi:hypothetical protein
MALQNFSEEGIMLRRNLERRVSFLTGVATSILIAQSSLFAENALVDDFASGTDQNNFESYWYYYDDNGGTKPDDRPQAAPQSKPSVIDVAHPTTHPRHAAGVLTDTFKIWDYKFLIASEPGGNKYGSMPFTYGQSWKASYAAQPFVGIGTNLCDDGGYIDITGADTVSYRLRAHATDLMVNFRIETYDIIMDSSFAYYQYSTTLIKGAWTPVNAPIAALQQYSWKPTEFPLTLAKAAKLSWEVHSENNSAVFGLKDSTDTLDIDDIVIHHYKFVPLSVWNYVAQPHPANGLFSNFEKGMPVVSSQNGNPLGTFWYAYNDHDIGGSSQVLGGTRSDSAGFLTLDWKENSGYNNKGYGAFANFKLGPKIKKQTSDSTVVQGFVGIGVNLYDSANNNYFNAQEGKLGNKGAISGSTKSIYFDYVADLDNGCKYMVLEISDSNDVADKAHPARKDKRSSGVVWYRNLPMTTTWRSVEIPFDSLVIHKNWKGYVAIPLCVTALAKLQFKVQGPENAQGIFQIDNIFFPGCDFGFTSVKNSDAHSPSHSEFRATLKNNNLKIFWKPAAGLTKGTIGLFDAKGMLVKTVDATSAKDMVTDISVRTLAAGSYFVKLKGVDAAGTAISQSTSMIIMK